MNLQTSKKIFDNMLERIMNAPINLYYDVTPIGTIQARFGKDLKNIDKRLYDRGCSFVRLCSGSFRSSWWLRSAYRRSLVGYWWCCTYRIEFKKVCYLLLTKEEDWLNQLTHWKQVCLRRLTLAALLSVRSACRSFSTAIVSKPCRQICFTTKYGQACMNTNSSAWAK